MAKNRIFWGKIKKTKKCPFRSHNFTQFSFLHFWCQILFSLRKIESNFFAYAIIYIDFIFWNYTHLSFFTGKNRFFWPRVTPETLIFEKSSFLAKNRIFWGKIKKTKKCTPRSYDFTQFFVYNFDVGLRFHGEKNGDRFFLTQLYIRIIIFYRKKSIFLTLSNPWDPNFQKIDFFEEKSSFLRKNQKTKKMLI